MNDKIIGCLVTWRRGCYVALGGGKRAVSSLSALIAAEHLASKVKGSVYNFRGRAHVNRDGTRASVYAISLN